MSQVEIRTVTTIRHEYAIPTPANWAEINKAMITARNDMHSAGKDPSYDDAAHFRSDDEHVVLYWEDEPHHEQP